MSRESGSVDRRAWGKIAGLIDELRRDVPVQPELRLLKVLKVISAAQEQRDAVADTAVRPEWQRVAMARCPTREECRGQGGVAIVHEQRIMKSDERRGEDKDLARPGLNHSHRLGLG